MRQNTSVKTETCSTVYLDQVVSKNCRGLLKLSKSAMTSLTFDSSLYSASERGLALIVDTVETCLASPLHDRAKRSLCC